MKLTEQQIMDFAFALGVHPINDVVAELVPDLEERKKYVQNGSFKRWHDKAIKHAEAILRGLE